jgi:AraC-like DNA-binding protein
MAWEIARPSRTRALPGVDMAGFCYRGDGPLELRAIPHPAVMVVVEFGDSAFDVHDAAGRSWSGSVAAGILSRPLDARVQTLACVQLRLSPLVAQAVLGVPAVELGGRVVALDDLWGRDASRIRERLHHARTWPDRFALIHTALSGRLQRGRVVDPEVALAWRRIVASHGRVRVGDLAARTGWSRQRLWSRFGAQVGLTPKGAAMLVRFDHAIHRLAAGHAPARVAADGGYADQSHLHRDVRAFTAATPGAAAGEPWLAVDDTAWPAA